MNRARFTDEDWEEAKGYICGDCAWGDISTLVPWLYQKLKLLDAGCPLERDELTDEEWMLLADFRIVRDRWIKENVT